MKLIYASISLGAFAVFAQALYAPLLSRNPADELNLSVTGLNTLAVALRKINAIETQDSKYIDNGNLGAAVGAGVGVSTGDGAGADDGDGAEVQVRAQVLNVAQDLLKRSDSPLLDTILGYLNDSGAAIVVLDASLLNPQLLQVVIDTTIWILKQNLINLTDLLIAIERSGLVFDILNLTLEDPEVLPGLIRITKEVMLQSNLDFSGLLKRDAIVSEEDDELNDVEILEAFLKWNTNNSKHARDLENTEEFQLDKRENEMLNEVFIALRNSGLAVSVIRHLLTTPELAQPNAYFLVSILESHAIEVSDLLKALKESRLIWDSIASLLKNPQIVKEFGGKIILRVTKGLVPQKFIDDWF